MFLRYLIRGIEQRVKYLDADQVEDLSQKTIMKKMRKDYSFYTKEEADKVVKKTTVREYKDTLEGNTYLCQAWR